MDNKKLDTLRGDINSLDDKILDLLKQRAEIVTEIGEQKKSKTDIIDIKREQKDIECRKLIDSIEDDTKELIKMDRRIFFDDRGLNDEDIDYGQVLLTKEL